MRMETNGNRAVQTFDSVGDLVDVAVRNAPKATTLMREMRRDAKWFGGVSSIEQLARVAREGLPSDGIKAANIADERVTSVERDHDVPSFYSYFDVTGSEVDVGRYLAGEPECMTNFHMVELPRAGRIITLVVSITVNSHIKPSAIRKRGQEVMALVFALERIGLQVELWADSLADGGYGSTRKQSRVRVMVKAPGEPLDAGRAMFAFTHPGMLRGLTLPVMHELPETFRTPLGVGSTYGSTAAKQDVKEYPEGSILIPPMYENSESETLVTDTMRELGLIND